jgi:Fe-S-cluster containining protein
MAGRGDNDTPEEAAPALEPSVSDEMAGRQSRSRDVETAVFEGIRSTDGGPVAPVRLKPTNTFKFRCHKGVSCWNVCCHGADVTLTPCDILVLARHFGVRPGQFVKDYTVPAIHAGSGLPVPKLVMTGAEGKGPCVFMDETEGCTVYEARPATCRYYPLGLGAMKMKGHEQREDMYFLVKEAHCRGHLEDREQTVQEFRAEQGVEPYDLLNERWIDILMKMASWRSVGGPMGKDVSKQTKQMFYTVSTDIDAFRRFVFETKFLQTYEIDDDMVASLRENDEALLQLGFDWLRNVMFNEPTIAMKQDVLRAAIGAAREEMGGA